MIQGEIVKEYIPRFPDTPSKTLANLIYKENQNVFTNHESLRSLVRYYRGQSGNADRKKRPEDEYRKERGEYNPFDDLPEGLTYYNEWEPYIVEGERVLCIADIHSPYYDKRAVTTALKYGVRKKADTVLVLGDLIDFFAVSFWEKDPRKRNIQNEINMTVGMLEFIRNLFPDANIIIKIGNHDERIERYLKVKAPELLGFKALSYDSIFDAERLGVDTVPDKRLVQIGGLNCIHGHEFNKSFFSPVNPARGLYLRGKENAICAHYHRTSEHAEKTMTDDVTVCWSIGCLCDLRPTYAPYNAWNHGCAMIYRDGDNFYVKNRKIINGEIY